MDSCHLVLLDPTPTQSSDSPPATSVIYVRMCLTCRPSLSCAVSQTAETSARSLAAASFGRAERICVCVVRNWMDELRASHPSSSSSLLQFVIESSAKESTQFDAAQLAAIGSSREHLPCQQQELAASSIACELTGCLCRILAAKQLSSLSLSLARKLV